MRRSAVGWLALVALATGTLHAEPAVGIALDYQAHASCPESGALLREVMARTPRARAATAGEDALALRIRIDEVPGGSHGELMIGTAADGSARREVSAVDCRQVVSAFALMIALVIDPDAATSPEPPPPPAPAPKPPPPAPAPAPPPPARRERDHTEVHAGAGIELTNAIAPELVPSPEVFAELALLGKSSGHGGRLSFLYARHLLEKDTGAGELVLVRGRLDRCYEHVLAAPLWLAGCGTLEGGVLGASGQDVTPSASVTRPWFAGGATARVELAAGSLFRFELGGNALFPFVRDRFFLYENATLRETPVITFGLSAGVSLRLM